MIIKADPYETIADQQSAEGTGSHVRKALLLSDTDVRFPTTEEDEPLYRLLCNEYPEVRE